MQFSYRAGHISLPPNQARWDIHNGKKALMAVVSCERLVVARYAISEGGGISGTCVGPAGARFIAHHVHR